MEIYTDTVESAKRPDDLVGDYALPMNPRLAAAPERCVLVMQQNLSPAHLANASAILSMSIGQRYPELIGAAWVDHSGNSHAGISKVGIPVLASTVEDLQKLREEAVRRGCDVIDCPVFAQQTMSYEEFATTMGNRRPDEIDYLGLALIGNKKTINKVTGRLGLWR
jgi:hypothetical protein